MQPLEERPDVFRGYLMVRKDMVDLLDEDLLQRSPVGLPNAPIVEKGRECADDVGAQRRQPFLSGADVRGMKDQRIVEASLFLLGLRTRRFNVCEQSADRLGLLPSPKEIDWWTSERLSRIARGSSSNSDGVDMDICHRARLRRVG